MRYDALLPAHFIGGSRLRLPGPLGDVLVQDRQRHLHLSRLQVHASMDRHTRRSPQGPPLSDTAGDEGSAAALCACSGSEDPARSVDMREHGTMTAAALLERTRELNELSDAVADAHQARGRVVLVEAPAGLGKTQPAVRGSRAGVSGGVRGSAGEGERAGARLRLRVRAAVARAGGRWGVGGRADPASRRRRGPRRAGVRSDRLVDAYAVCEWFLRGPARPVLVAQQSRRRASGRADDR